MERPQHMLRKTGVSTNQRHIHISCSQNYTHLHTDVRSFICRAALLVLLRDAETENKPVNRHQKNWAPTPWTGYPSQELGTHLISWVVIPRTGHPPLELGTHPTHLKNWMPKELGTHPICRCLGLNSVGGESSTWYPAILESTVIPAELL